MRIAITGSRGFLGSATAFRAKSCGHEIIPFDKRDGNDVLGDLSGLNGSNAIIHLSGILGVSELFNRAEEAIDINIKGTVRILEWCRYNNAGFVGINMPDIFFSPYSITKVAAHSFAEAWRKAYGVKTAYTKAFNVYGSGQKYGAGHPRKIIPTFSYHAWRGLPIPIWGDGSQTVDLVHVDDVAMILVEATEFIDGQVIHAGTGISVPVLEVANFVRETCGSKAEHKFEPMRIGQEKFPDSENTANAKETKRRLGWHPFFNWNKLEETVRSYKP